MPPVPAPTAVVKLGGSLLDLPDLSQRLDQLRPEWGPRPLMVVGGGGAADLVRQWDQQQQLGEERSHWLALDALDLTARLVESLWSPACVSRREEYVRVWEQGRVPLARSREWFEAARHQETPSPPPTWETTTDTIAAWIASLTHSASLWFLKSVPCPSSLTEAIGQAAVDPQCASWMPVHRPVYWVDVRRMSGTSKVGWVENERSRNPAE